MPASTDKPVGTPTSSSSFNPPRIKSVTEEQSQAVWEPPVKEEKEVEGKPAIQELRNEYIPLWMPIVAFILIIAAYLYCYAADINVNPLYRIGAIGISGFFAATCAYLKYKKDFQ